jgi:hypothetical protein
MENKSKENKIPSNLLDGFLTLKGHAHVKSPKRVLPGFAKVLAGGRVVGVNREKPFADRMLASGFTQLLEDVNSASEDVNRLVLDMVVTNLEAGVNLLGKQEVALAKMGGRLSEMALLYNKSRYSSNYDSGLQEKFEDTRLKLRYIAKETFDHTALFSNGPSKPIVVVTPSQSSYWERFYIDRCNLGSSGLVAIDSGKVVPMADGLLLDWECFSRAFDEWRHLCAINLLQKSLIQAKREYFSHKLKSFDDGQPWSAPPCPRVRSKTTPPHWYN